MATLTMNPSRSPLINRGTGRVRSWKKVNDNPMNQFKGMSHEPVSDLAPMSIHKIFLLTPQYRCGRPAVEGVGL